MSSVRRGKADVDGPAPIPFAMPPSNHATRVEKYHGAMTTGHLTLESWLDEHLREELRGAVLAAVMLAGASVVSMLLAWGFLVVLMFQLGVEGPIELFLPLLLFAVLFVIYPWVKDTDTGLPKALGPLARPQRTLVPNLRTSHWVPPPLGPAEVFAPGGRGGWAVILFAPMLMHLALEHVRKTYRLGQLNRPACAQVLESLVARDGKVFLHELFAQGGEDAIAVLSNLLMIDGVVLLKTEPAGLTLTQSLREKIAQGMS